MSDNKTHLGIYDRLVVYKFYKVQNFLFPIINYQTYTNGPSTTISD